MTNEKALEIVESMLADGLITAHIEDREFWKTVRKALGGSAEETQCSCYHLVEKRRYLSEYERGYRAAKGLPSRTYEDIEVGVCWGTKECKTCKCDGDVMKCDFYPQKKIRNKK